MRMSDEKINSDRVVKHLEIIQTVINRLGHDSFLVKGWSMAILTAGLIFLVREGLELDKFVWLFVISVGGFWILDGYFLRKERLFRKVYDHVRMQKGTDFEMNPEQHASEPKSNLPSAMFSVTLGIFYGIQFLAILAISLINCSGGNQP